MIDIIYEDSDLLVVNKPPGVVVYNQKNSTTQEKSLAFSLIQERKEIKNIGGERHGAVHRLDKDTSGAVMFAKNENTLAFLQTQLLEKKVKKRYITLVFRNTKQEEGVIRTFIARSPKDRRKQKAFCSPPGKREAVTYYRVLKDYQNYTLLEVSIETGRKHQIRCHLAFLGHPVVGDKLYAFKDHKTPSYIARQLLHAWELTTLTPSGEKTFRAKLPEDFKQALIRLPKY